MIKPPGKPGPSIFLAKQPKRTPMEGGGPCLHSAPQMPERGPQTSCPEPRIRELRSLRFVRFTWVSRQPRGKRRFWGPAMLTHTHMVPNLQPRLCGSYPKHAPLPMDRPHKMSTKAATRTHTPWFEDSNPGSAFGFHANPRLCLLGAYRAYCPLLKTPAPNSARLITSPF